MAGFLDALKASSAPQAQPSSFLAALAKAPAPPVQKQTPAPSLLSRLNSIPAGFNRGVADIAGLPVDTTVNAMNLGKSGIEAGMLAAGRTPPTWLDPTSQAQLANVVGSSPWIARELGSAAQNPNPKDTPSRLLYGGARFGAGTLAGGENAEARIAKAGERDLAGIAKEIPGMRAGVSGLTRGQQAAAVGREGLLTPGERSGSTPLRQLEAKMASHPWTSGPFAKLAARRQQSINEAAAGAIGEPAETLDSPTLGNAAERTGKVFEAVRTNDQRIPVDRSASTAFLSDLDNETSGLLPNEGSILDHPLVRTLQGLMGAEEQPTAKQLGQLSSKLGKAAYKQITGANGDRDLGQALNAVKTHVDDLLEQHLTGEGKAAYAKARKEYRALMQLTSRQNVVNPSTGDVNGVALANYLQKSDRPGFLYGRNTSPLYQAARFAQAFKPIVGNSGTATREMNFRTLEDFLMGVPANLGARAYLSRPGGLLAEGTMRGAQGAARAVPRGLQGLLANPVVAGGVARPR